MTALASYAAIGLLFAGAAAAGSGDFALIVPGQPRICSKTEQSCQMARVAIRNGWFLKTIAPDTPTICQAWPQCFSEQSNHIQGYN